MIQGILVPPPSGAVAAPYVTVGVHLPGLMAGWASVEFLIDTGADYTTVNSLTAIARLGIPFDRMADPSQWPRHEKTGGVGGTCINYVQTAQFMFTHTDQRDFIIQAELRIMDLHTANTNVPPLLGRDLLRNFSFALDVARLVVTLT